MAAGHLAQYEAGRQVLVNKENMFVCFIKGEELIE
jgi:hypothetical protein